MAPKKKKADRVAQDTQGAKLANESIAPASPVPAAGAGAGASASMAAAAAAAVSNEKEVDDSKKPKVRQYLCSHCNVNHDLIKEHFGSEQMRRAKRGNKAHCKLYDKEYSLAKKYGLTLAAYEMLFKKQHNRCAICADSLKRDETTHVDHDHTSKKVRGLLDANCNKGIGLLGDMPLVCVSAALYLLRNKHDPLPSAMDKAMFVKILNMMYERVDADPNIILETTEKLLVTQTKPFPVPERKAKFLETLDRMRAHVTTVLPAAAAAATAASVKK